VTDASTRIRSAILATVERALPLTRPAYDPGLTQDAARPPASLLLVHGAGSGPWVFRGWAQAFPGITVASVDLHAGIDVARASHDDYAGNVTRATRALPQPGSLCGWSMGGLVVLQASQRVRPHSVIIGIHAGSDSGSSVRLRRPMTASRSSRSARSPTAVISAQQAPRSAADIAPAAGACQRAADRAGCRPPAARALRRQARRRTNVRVSATTRERRRGTELPRFQARHD